MKADWPTPAPAALAHSDALAELIRARIAAAGGWLDFAQYMDLVLYAPRLGYYSAGAQKFGAAGDFVTAPEISPVFGDCFARAVAPLLEPGDAILELGAGSGALAAALLAAIERSGGPVPAYRILEVSAELRARQQERLTDHAVEWLDALPRDFRGVILANEVADALPVRRFRWQGPGKVQALGVVVAEGAFEWAPHDADPALSEAVRALCDRAAGPWPPGYTSELCEQLTPWVASLADCLARGLVMLCDYGLPAREYYHPQRARGTLVCHYRHRAHGDPFLWPGLQDISAWVDMSAAAAAGVAAGLDLVGYSTQANFLLANGALDNAPVGDAIEQARHAGALRQLLLPGEMGERFKVLALGRNIDAGTLDCGRDLRHLL